MKQTGKRFGFVAVLVALFALAPAAPSFAQSQDLAPLASTEKSQSVDVTVFGDGFAQVEETRFVVLKAGKNLIQLNGVAGKYRQDSLRIIDVKGKGDFKYKSATYQPANLTSARILELTVGKPISARVGTGLNARIIRGTLISVTAGQMIIEASDGTAHVTSTSDIDLPSLPTGLSATASLVMEAEVTIAGAYEINFLYETEGLNWSAKHSIVYDEETRKIGSFETTVNVVNHSGTTFDNANLWLLSGAVRERGGQLKASDYARRAASFSAESATAESVGERKVYRVPGRVNIGDGQSRQIPLFTGKNVPVVHEYFVSTSSRYGDNTGLVPVNARLRLKNCDEDNLGNPLPAGIVKVYQRNSENKLQLTASSDVKELAVDETFEIGIGNSSDVKAERTLVKSNRIAPSTQGTRTSPAQKAPEWEHQEFSVKVHNFKEKKDVDVIVEVDVPADQDDVQPLTRKSATEASGTVHAEPGKGAMLNYTLRVRTY